MNNEVLLFMPTFLVYNKHSWAAPSYHHSDIDRSTTYHLPTRGGDLRPLLCGPLPHRDPLRRWELMSFPHYLWQALICFHSASHHGFKAERIISLGASEQISVPSKNDLHPKVVDLGRFRSSWLASSLGLSWAIIAELWCIILPGKHH